jgi:hypothetical protein
MKIIVWTQAKRLFKLFQESIVVNLRENYSYEILSIFKIHNLKKIEINDDDIIIVIGAQFFNNNDLLQLIKNNKLIIYNTEPLCDEKRKKDIFNCLDKVTKLKFTLLEYCDFNYKILKDKYENIDIKLLKFGYYNNYINRINLNMKKDIDILFYGDITKRRRNIMNILKNNNLRVHFTNKTYDLKKRDNLISRSKIVLDIFRNNNYKCNNLYRLSYLICNNVTILAEYNDNEIYKDLKEYVFFSDYNDILINSLKILKKDKNLLQNKSQKAFDYFKKNYSSLINI